MKKPYFQPLNYWNLAKYHPWINFEYLAEFTLMFSEITKMVPMFTSYQTKWTLLLHQIQHLIHPYSSPPILVNLGPKIFCKPNPPKTTQSTSPVFYNTPSPTSAYPYPCYYPSNTIITPHPSLTATLNLNPPCIPNQILPSKLSLWHPIIQETDK